MNYQELVSSIRAKQSFLCVGLDTDIKKLPQHLLSAEDPIFEFNKAIIDATAQYCMAYKPNLAFYESMGVKGWVAFEKTVEYLRTYYGGHFIIADAKRGDIGNTSKLYARTFFEELDVDAVTVAPYMGEDSVTPFLGYKGKWVILLALTSNKGSHDFQLMEAQALPAGAAQQTGEKLFERVIRKSQEWERTVLETMAGEAGSENGSAPAAVGSGMMYVVGATQGSAFADIRRLAPDHFLLVPGVGAQGGSLEEVCRYGMNAQCGLIVNSSRAIIYADATEQFADVAGQKAREVQQQMAAFLR